MNSPSLLIIKNKHFSALHANLITVRQLKSHTHTHTLTQQTIELKTNKYWISSLQFELFMRQLWITRTLCVIRPSETDTCQCGKEFVPCKVGRQGGEGVKGRVKEWSVEKRGQIAQSQAVPCRVWICGQHNKIHEHLAGCLCCLFVPHSLPLCLSTPAAFDIWPSSECTHSQRRRRRLRDASK